MIGFVHKHSFVSSVQKSFRFLFHLTGDCIFRRLYFFPVLSGLHADVLSGLHTAA